MIGVRVAYHPAMAVASWIFPVLWRAQEWEPALDQLVREVASAETTSRAREAVLELGEPFEYLVADRKKAIAVYELAGEPYSARRLAIELGWWAARARLTTALRALDTSEQLAIEEAEAWWDAGQPDLCALAAAGIVPAKRSERADDVARLVAGTALVEAALAAAARAGRATGVVAADAFVSAARLAGAAGRSDDQLRFLEHAIEADPTHDVAASLFVRLAMQSPDSESIQRFLRTRLAALEANDWYVALRVTAFALIDSPHHRGLGLRLLRHLLERAYEDPPGQIPAHLAIWSVLAAQAKIDRTRRDLLPLAIRGLEVSSSPVDRVWLGALAAEISLRDADDPIVAGRYAEIVAEHAPEHPIMRELVAAVARPAPAKRSKTIPPLPAEAITAAKAVEAAGWADISLDDIILGAASAAMEPEPAPAPSSAPEPARPPEVAAPARTAAPTAKPPSSASLRAPAATASLPRRVEPPVKVAVGGPAQHAVPAKAPKAAGLPPLPPLARGVLDALRTPDRPSIPARLPDPPDAKERARRIAIAIDVRFYGDGGISGEGISRDLSTSGLFVSTTVDLPIDTDLTLVLMVPGKEAFLEEEFRSRARVVRKEARGYGVQLIEPAPALIAALAAL